VRPASIVAVRMPDTPTHEFDADTAVTHTAAGHYQAEITDRWNIGANPNGGYLLAAAARAIAQEVPNHPDPFTVTAHYLRPGEAGTADISVEVVRTGRKLATLRSTVSQGGKGKLEILATFGDLADATGPTAVAVVRPTIPPPADCLPRAPFNSDGFTISNMAYRTETRLDPATGWLTGKPSGVATINGWTRFADGREPDALSLLFFADSLPPAVFEVLDGTGWVPTIELTVHVRKRPAPGWLQARMTTRYLMDGYFEEDGEIWDSTGTLVCQSRQLGMIFRP
jgi:acyl-CoA thioesterase